MRSSRPLGSLVVSLCLLGVTPLGASAQLTSPCELGCAAVLGATGFTAATGALVARGRSTGGVSSVNEVIGIWGGSFLVFVGSGVALSGNGERQERAVYSAGLGALAGSALWLGIESVLPASNSSRKVAASIMGAAAGAVVGGIYGAVTYERPESRGGATFAVQIPF